MLLEARLRSARADVCALLFGLRQRRFIDFLSDY
jgi:hypothetical protein